METAWFIRLIREWFDVIIMRNLRYTLNFHNLQKYNDIIELLKLYHIFKSSNENWMWFIKTTSDPCNIFLSSNIYHGINDSATRSSFQQENFFSFFQDEQVKIV